MRPTSACPSDKMPNSDLERDRMLRPQKVSPPPNYGGPFRMAKSDRLLVLAAFAFDEFNDLFRGDPVGKIIGMRIVFIDDQITALMSAVGF